MEDRTVLCGANRYEKKFYMNPAYDRLPKAIKDELRIMCTLFVEEVSGIILFQFDEKGSLKILVTSREDDMYFDEIGSRLKVKQLQTEKKELFSQLEDYYHAFGN